ncbi:lanthionine synthetase C family protein [Kitasatospora sp. NPDC088346]|uniref:lanthionine synthetase C family protein n=1 Tax=Kitasatospora sp. NPDC088346 TaxID=3364073 RepID=UPI00381E52BB
MSLRERAALVVAATARRLADPKAVETPDGPPPSAFRAGSLSDGAPGIALLHAELAHRDPSHRTAALRWLARAADLASQPGQPPAPGPQGLYGPVAALSFALHRAAPSPDSHAGARAHLADQVSTLAVRRADGEQARIAGGRSCTTLAGYDTISGLAGMGGHLLELDRPGPTAQVLATLAHLALPVRAGGRELPGWWVAQDATTYRPVPPAEGHANLGAAHGVPGPLALLALAWRQGIRVPGQRAAITALARWLCDRAEEDAAGIWWPGQLSLDPAQDGRAGRPSWCYGGPGIARSLQLAGIALDVRPWRDAGVAALGDALTRLERPRSAPLDDAGLCHGWAGLLQTTWRAARDSGDPRLTARVPWVAGRLLDLVDRSGPFGFAAGPGRRDPEEHPAGFLTGAAGAALALHTFAADTAPATGWDRALLLA